MDGRLSPHVPVEPAARRGRVPVRPARGGDVRRPALGGRRLGNAPGCRALRQVHPGRVAAATRSVYRDDSRGDAAPGGARQGARPPRRDRQGLGGRDRRDHRQDAGGDHHDLERGRRTALRVRGPRGDRAASLDPHPAGAPGTGGTLAPGPSRGWSQWQSSSRS